MDDVRILCEDKFKAKKALKSLIIELRKIGLNVNSTKTDILEPGSGKHQEFLKRKSYELEVIDALINSKKKPIVAIAFHKIKEQLERLIVEREFHSREFRFCIGRICKIALCKDMSKPTDFFDTITEGIVENIAEFPECMDQCYTYLSAVDISTADLSKIQSFLINHKTAIYSWQNYLIWKLLALKQFRTDDLINHSIQMIEHDSNIANKSGAILYLGCCGNVKDKRLLYEDFKSFSDFLLQRHSLIALQEIEYSKIKEYVSDYVRDDAKGIYKHLHEKAEPLYIEPPKPIKYTDLIREFTYYA